MRFIPVVLLLALGGCDESRVLVVEMDGGTMWTGYYTVNDGEHNQISGGGDLTKEIEVPGGKVCWALLNRGVTGSIEAYLKVSTLLGTDTRGVGSTSEPFGVVTGCG